MKTLTLLVFLLFSLPAFAAWPSAVLVYDDGTEIEVNKDNIETVWNTAPIAGLKRINFNPPFSGATGDFSLVLSGADTFWVYKESANEFVFGYHRPSSLFFDPPLNTEPNPNGVEEEFAEIVFDKRQNRPIIEREQTEIPPGALVKTG